MVQKCCVPGCKTPADMPSHRIPINKKKVWLTKIGRPDLISVPNSELNKYRICHLHFSDEMVRMWSKIRLLMPDAEPILCLPVNNTNLETRKESQNLSRVPLDSNGKTCDISSNNGSSDCNVRLATTEIPLIDISNDESPTNIQTVNSECESQEVPDLTIINDLIVKPAVSSTSEKGYVKMTLKDLQILKLKNKLKLYQEKYYALNRKMKRLQEAIKRDKLSKKAKSDTIDSKMTEKRKAPVDPKSDSQIVKRIKKQSRR